MNTHVLGFPRIGAHRELKQAVEAFWKGRCSEAELMQVGEDLRRKHWQVQYAAGLNFVSTGDFSFYDSMLDMSVALGIIPERFAEFETDELKTYFKLARGDAQKNIPAMEMTKWFNTNYHYIVPEISETVSPQLISTKLLTETREAIALGLNPKPVIIGPITYLSLSKGVGGYDVWKKFDDILAVYAELIQELSELCEWIQLDEPILCADISAEAAACFPVACKKLNSAAGKSKLLLTTYFEELDDNLALALNSGCAGLHLDLVRGGRQLDKVLLELPAEMILSAGIVDGRNIWKTDYQSALKVLQQILASVGAERLWLSSSCSLLHSPVDLAYETELDPQIREWLAFAVQKCTELSELAEILATPSGESSAYIANQKAIESRRNSPLVHDGAVQEAVQSIVPEMYRRNSAYSERKLAQSWLKLPEFPTTTIGSFPQTREIRQQRRALRKGEITREEYNDFLKAEIRHVVEIQEELGLDVLVHGESERNDMVEYFGQQLKGFCFTGNGWVQSYGSRCVKPPVILGDISRPQAMTVEWLNYAQSLTSKPLKGMLTGPVTILCWSFVRDDMSREDVCRQIALAIRDEVLDLEKAGIRIIQIDEAALSEGMPLKQRDREAYLEWAVAAFRLATTGVADSTQVHTHMCYSEFNAIIKSIAQMDADVISIESSRSKMELLDCFWEYQYPNEIGPGVWDIHSPRVPDTVEIVTLLQKACEYIPRERLWVNPDCGLKTREWEETLASLRNMVNAAKILREV